MRIQRCDKCDAQVDHLHEYNECQVDSFEVCTACDDDIRQMLDEWMYPEKYEREEKREGG